jgi:4-hydroxy-tetrahydrodipicolinate synthase
MDRNSVNWEGYFLAMVTPFTRDGDLDEPALREVTELAIANGVDGLVPAGCTGEWWTLTDEERGRVFRAVVEQTRGRATVIGGACAIATSKAIELTRLAQETGCDGAMLTAPAYALPKEREIVHYFERISDAVTFPIMLYNNPNRVRRALSPELVSRLADIDTVVAIKDSSGDPDLQERTLAACTDRIRYFIGGTRNAARLVPKGCLGFVDSAIAHIAGDEGSRYYRALKAGDVALADTLVPDTLATEIHDLLWEDAGMFPASLKEVMNLLGRPGGYPREPLLPLTDEEREVARARMREIGIGAAVGAAR